MTEIVHPSGTQRTFKTQEDSGQQREFYMFNISNGRNIQRSIYKLCLVRHVWE